MTRPSFLVKWCGGVETLAGAAIMTGLLAITVSAALGVGYLILLLQAWAWNTLAPLMGVSVHVTPWVVMAWWIVFNFIIVAPVSAISKALRAKHREA